MNVMFGSLLRFLGTLVLLVAFLPASGIASPATAAAVPPAPASDRSRLESAAASSPLMFVENVGQADARTRFVVQGPGGAIFLTEDGIWYRMVDGPQGKEPQGLPLKGEGIGPALVPISAEQRKGVDLKVIFDGARPHPRLEPFGRLETRVSYLIGNDPSKWHSDVPVWEGVRYVDLYPGVDLEITGENGRLVQKMVANDGNNLRTVALKVEGADQVRLEEGRIKLATALGDITLPPFAPVARDGATLQELESGPILNGNVVARPFADPATLSVTAALVSSSDLLFSPFLGGTSADEAAAIAVDRSGFAYVAGETSSSDFPVTAGPYDPSLNGGTDVFAAKFNRAGTGLVYATFLGGAADDRANGLAVDGSGSAYLVGETSSMGFPTTSAAFRKTYAGGSQDAFATKLSPSGSALTYSTFLGGNDHDYAKAVAVDTNGSAYVAGYTTSSDFPSTPNAYDPSFNGFGQADPFLVKLNSSGSQPVYATFLGGTASDAAYGVALDASGAAYLTGFTTSGDFPVTPGAFDQGFNAGGYDGFVVKLNPAGTTLIYGTYLGGNNLDGPFGIAVDRLGWAYVAGVTFSSNFPTTPGAFDHTFNASGLSEGFVAKLQPSGSSLVYSTFIGGSSSDSLKGIAVDPAGAAFVVGTTSSSDFPTTPGAFDRVLNGDDAPMARLAPNGASLGYSVFLGGASSEEGLAIALDASGASYVAGRTASADFPIAAVTYDHSFNGVADGFVVKLRSTNSLHLPVILDKAYGGWTTGVNIRNPYSAANTVEIIYYDQQGHAVGSDWKSLPPNGSWGIYTGGRFGENWAGSAIVQSDQNVVAVVNEVGPGAAAMGYSAAPPARTVFLPVVLDSAYGGWTSGVGIKNTSTAAALVTIAYYSSAGALVKSESQSVPSNGYWGTYQGGKFGGNWAGSAIITAAEGVVAVVNEVHSSGRAISYNGFPQASTKVYLPAMLNNAYGGWTTGVAVQNPNLNPASGTITYYDNAGAPKASKNLSIPAHGSLGLYQGSV
ncbi:MAG: SBBP repeat-containing protein, partial [Chloroflexi bacterium]|nr:SBBP repeat-containing protein [Chloroflexota bacterium]